MTTKTNTVDPRQIPAFLQENGDEWLNGLVHAALHGHACFLRGRIRATGEYATILCVKTEPDEEGTVELIPIAHVPDESPYDYFISPIEDEAAEAA
jgi:hypothetical protein